MNCPRDGAILHTEREHGIEVDRCPTCKGAWYDFDELAELEATVADADDRLGTIEYSKHQTTLACPVCAASMEAFNYRAYNLELDACAAGHGFWLDAGESDRVREIMQDRVRGLRRSASAQQAWHDAKRGGGVLGKMKGMFGGRR
jgi:Zn-finger nucleic acid-binding protein